MSDMDSFSIEPSFVDSHYEAPGWFITTYYWFIMLFCGLTIVLGSLTIDAKERCSSKLTGSDKTALNSYEIVGILSLISASILGLMTGYALWNKMGLSDVANKSWDAVKKPFKHRAEATGQAIKHHHLNESVEAFQRDLDSTRLQQMLDRHPHHQTLLI